jgi:DNA repair exonuclease SbcCD ATPase subunit
MIKTSKNILQNKFLTFLLITSVCLLPTNNLFAARRRGPKKAPTQVAPEPLPQPVPEIVKPTPPEPIPQPEQLKQGGQTFTKEQVAEYDTLRIQAAILQGKLVDAEEKIEALESQPRSTEETAALQAKLEVAQEQIQRLQQRPTEQALSSTQQELALVKQAVEAQKSAITERDAEAAQLQAQNAMFVKGRADAVERASAAEEQVEELTAENTGLVAEKESITANLFEIVEQRESNKTKIAELEKSATEKDATIKTKDQQILQITKAREYSDSELNKTFQVVGPIQATIQQLMQRYKIIQTNVEKLESFDTQMDLLIKAAEKERAEKTGQSQAVTDRFERMRKITEEAVKAFSEIQTKQTDLSTSFEATIGALQTVVDGLKASYDVRVTTAEKDEQKYESARGNLNKIAEFVTAAQSVSAKGVSPSPAATSGIGEFVQKIEAKVGELEKHLGTYDISFQQVSAQNTSLHQSTQAQSAKLTSLSGLVGQFDAQITTLDAHKSARIVPVNLAPISAAVAQQTQILTAATGGP